MIFGLLKQNILEGIYFKSKIQDQISNKIGGDQMCFALTQFLELFIKCNYIIFIKSFRTKPPKLHK
jgi:hypothetical protein